MSKNLQIHIIGNEDTILLFGLLGLKGTIVKKNDDFFEVLKPLLNNREIGMLIIAMNLPNEIIDFLIDLKVNNTRPLIHFLPDIYQEDIESDYVFRNKIYDAIGDIVSQKESTKIQK